MNKYFDVVALGESLVDVLINYKTGDDATKMIGNAGGAPLNVLIALSKLSKETSFLGKVSRDVFGGYLLSTMQDNGVDSSGVVHTDLLTSLAMVHLDDKGNRSFSFYRTNTADINYQQSEIDKSIIDKAKIFHFGSVSMTDEPCRTATIEAAKYAKAKGVKVSFDPNLRLNLWSDKNDALQFICKGLEIADYVKMSDEEVSFITGEEDYKKGAEILLEKYNFELLSVTLGSNGAACYCNNLCCFHNTYDTDCVDTTGSGDASWGATLYKILEVDCNLKSVDENTLSDFVNFANAAGSICASKFGAIKAMPTKEEIYECMNSVPLLIK